MYIWICPFCRRFRVALSLSLTLALSLSDFSLWLHLFSLFISLPASLPTSEKKVHACHFFFLRACPCPSLGCKGWRRVGGSFLKFCPLLSPPPFPPPFFPSVPSSNAAGGRGAGRGGGGGAGEDEGEFLCKQCVRRFKSQHALSVHYATSAAHKVSLAISFPL